MARTHGRKSTVQAWIVLNADDPESASAFAIARAQLEGGAALEGLRRVRVFELSGPLPSLRDVEALLHRSTQFYNPHKERCFVRTSGGDPAPLVEDERAAIVWERGGDRRAAAERWWLHETGKKIEVREGAAWLARFAPEASQSAALEALVQVRDRRHGLLCNPHSQDYRVAGDEIPLPWWTGVAADEEGRP